MEGSGGTGCGTGSGAANCQPGTGFASMSGRLRNGNGAVTYARRVRIFLAGATGALGRQLVPRLLAAGHQVTGMTRSPEGAAGLAAAGAEAVVCDVYDPGLAALVADARPDLVLHQLTALPRDPALIPQFSAANNRIRREGTGALLRAAADAGADRVLAQSVAWELPGDGAAAVREHESAVLAAGGVVIRYGRFHGPGTYHDHDLPPAPTVGVERAAEVTVRLLGAGSGVVLVTDEETVRLQTRR